MATTISSPTSPSHAQSSKSTLSTQLSATPPSSASRWTTPRTLSTLTVAVIAIGLLTGLVSLFGVQERSGALDDLATKSGPLSTAAQNLYRSLSDADATANSAFLSGGLEPAATRKRYETDLASASHALSLAVASRDPAELSTSDHPLVTLSTHLPVYAGLVETARVNNRQGLPIGAAYQREASTLMRSKLLPAAQRLYQSEADRLAADQGRAAAIPIWEILLGIVLLTLLVITQVYLRRRTNRVFNVGLLVSTGGAVLSLLWVLILSIAVGINVQSSQRDGSAQVDQLARARVAALNARANETLTVVARGTGQTYEKDFVRLAGQLGGDGGDGLLNQALTSSTDDAVRGAIAGAMRNAGTWLAAHRAIRAADDAGNYDQAVQLTIGADPTSAAVAFDRLDADLRAAIDRTRATFDARISTARAATTGAGAAMVLLAILTAGGAAYGSWQRLREYR